MKNAKNQMAVVGSAGLMIGWSAKTGGMLLPKRKRAWSARGKTLALPAVNIGWWLKDL